MWLHSTNDRPATAVLRLTGLTAHDGLVVPGTAGGEPAPELRAEEVLDLMVRHGSLEFAFQFGQGIATAAYESFHQAFVDVPPSAHRDFVEALIPYMLERSA